MFCRAAFDEFFQTDADPAQNLEVVSRADQPIEGCAGLATIFSADAGRSHGGEYCRKLATATPFREASTA